MKPFPNLILSPTTAHRIPSTSSTVEFIHKLLSHEVNVYAFLMDVDLLLHAQIKGFQNDPSRALLDLITQLPQHVRDAVFPPPPPDPNDEEEDSSDEGKDSPTLKGFSLKISDAYSISVSLDPPQIPPQAPPPKKIKPLSKFLSPRFEDQQLPKKKQRSGFSLGM